MPCINWFNEVLTHKISKDPRLMLEPEGHKHSGYFFELSTTNLYYPLFRDEIHFIYVINKS